MWTSERLLPSVCSHVSSEICSEIGSVRTEGALEDLGGVVDGGGEAHPFPGS